MALIYRPPQYAGLDILYCDESLLALNKPSGLLSVPGRGEGKADCLAGRVQAEYPDALVVSARYVDIGDSGDGARYRGATGIKPGFGEAADRKKYLAIVAGRLAGARGK